jgi:hypothetical protein
MVTLLAGGTGIDPAYTYYRANVAANSTVQVLLPNSPLILEDGETLRGFQTTDNLITVQVYGLEETA